ncbi:acyl-CoA Delta(11) desaturase [Manduca sexta]|uniref:acyl-CoA Delta(11) desaturase n=1 Tax=Manduca sexta TaxID=7130 RepID=UPI00188E6462|nr:acyl-CoA Delta(11) desaturase [Manduca sexta]
MLLCECQAPTSRYKEACILFVAGDIGVTWGAHRLWSHRSLRVRLPLLVLLMIFQSISFQNSALTWARDRRFCDTDADPYNSKRILFYSHVGWLLVRKHPMLLEQGKLTDLGAGSNISRTRCWPAVFILLGDGYHNFHHVFPWDYRAAELESPFNITAKFIKFVAWIVWAHDLKTVPQDFVGQKAIRTSNRRRGSNDEEADSCAKVL